ncbi:MAG: SDR family NAD(P)-dependent oxidoreductase [Bacteroidetes bacterium]|nr:SDR family NAD(P)-dependent oxidoreductase [Bacteroidota bacterium]
MKISGNKILITGGGSGIGYGLSERFIKENNTVIICGRRQAVLDEAKQKLPTLITYQCDLAIESERKKLYQWITVNHPDLNVLINNAGIQQWETLEDADFIEKVKEEITINIEAPLHLTSLFTNLASLNTIMNVTSGLAFAPLLRAPVYSATKAFLHSFTISFREILKHKQIEVIEIIPPALNTDLGGKGKHDYAPPVSEFIEAIFLQLIEGKNELSFGFSEKMLNANENLQLAFKRMNQID